MKTIKKLRKRVLFLFMLTINVSLALTQNQTPPFFTEYIDCNDCLLEEISDNQTQTYLIGCNKQSNWFNSNSFFMINPSSSVKNVGVNFVFLLKDDGTGNFLENDTEHQQCIIDIVNIMNAKMANLTISTCGGNNSHSKIYFQVNNLYINDSYLWNNDNDNNTYKCPSRSNWYLRPKALEIDNDPAIPKGIDVFFTNGANAYDYNVVQNNSNLIGAQYACSMFPTVNIDEGSYVHMPDVYIKYHWMKNWATQIYNQPWLPVVYSWFVNSVAQTIIHELGHSLGLSHDLTCVAHNIMNPSGNGCSHDYLTNSQLYSSHRNLSITNIRRFVREQSVLDDALVITDDRSIDFDTRVYRDIIIESGGALSVTCKLLMPSIGKIVVKPGGKLIVDGGIITSALGSPWQGIEVYGNSSAHQWPDANGNYQQGRVVLNNATIENAVCAINLWKSDDNTKTGGIVHATGTTFKNNAKSVHALLYRNFHPTNGKEMEYNSWFDNCTFEITADYPATHTFYKHVDLNQVNGIKFKGCDFSLSPDASNVSNYNQAIAAYNAGFKVEARCTGLTTPCNAWDKSTFNGFRVGVYAGNSGVNNNSYLINRALFTGNSIGVLSNNVDNAILINSEFYSAKNQYNWEDCTYGIFVESGAGFTFEDNKFFKQAGAPLSNYIGIGAFNCETVSDIYKNEFTGLTAGNYAYGKNYSDFLYQGLEYICNINTGNWADFYVKAIDNDTKSGIQSKQGSTLMPARNQFSPTGATWHFYNETKNLIGYYYCQSCPGHYPAYVENVTREPVTVSGNCLSHYGSENPSTSIVLSTASKLTMETAFAFADMDFNSVKVLYNDLKDGGSTAGTISDISQALPSDMMELRARLLGDSPHLTTEVLKLVADRTDVFTEAAIFDILAANPDELKKEELMKYLEEKENPLPDYMISILKQVAEGTSYRTVLEMEMAKYSHDRSRAAGDMIRSILNDEELDIAQLRLWLTNLGGIEAERQIIASYAHAGDFTLALALAETLPQTYQLEGDDLTGHNQFVSVLQMQQNLVTSGRNIDQLTQSEQDQLRVIAEADNAVSAPMAKAVLESFYGADFSRCKPIDGTSSYKSQPASPNQLAVAYGLSITVKPNPAKEWAAFDYTLPEGVETASLEIADANGKHVETIALRGNRGQQLVDTRTWITGQYIYTLKVAGFTQSGKLVVVK